MYDTGTGPHHLGSRLSLTSPMPVHSFILSEVHCHSERSEESETQALTVILSKAKNLLQEAGMELQILHSA